MCHLTGKEAVVKTPYAKPHTTGPGQLLFRTLRRVLRAACCVKHVCQELASLRSLKALVKDVARRVRLLWGFTFPCHQHCQKIIESFLAERLLVPSGKPALLRAFGELAFNLLSSSEPGRPEVLVLHVSAGYSEPESVALKPPNA